MEQVDEAQRVIGHPLKHLERVAAPQADIGEAPVADVAKGGRNAIQEGLGTDKAMIGQHVGAIGEMLARAESDLEMERAIFAEQPGGADLALERNLDCRKQSLDQLLLALAQLVTARPTVKAVEREGVAGLE